MARSVSSNAVRAKVFVVGLSVMIALASALTILMVALVSSKQAEAAFPGTNGRIVFDSDRASPSGHSELYTMNPDGSDQRRLTFTARASETNAAFSSDGMKIAFDRISGRSGLRGMWIMNADGTRIRRLANAPGDPSWSPGGARIAFIKDGDLHTIKTDGTGLRHVEATPRIYEDSPAWSPDGTRIAFYKYNRDYLGIFTVRPDGTGLRSLTSFGGWPNWSPDGTKIIFNSFDREADRLYTVRVADGSLALIRSGDYLVGPAFSPDGTKITYHGFDTSGLDGVVRVVSLNADDSGTPTPLTPDGSSSHFPDWGPA